MARHTNHTIVQKTTSTNHLPVTSQTKLTLILTLTINPKPQNEINTRTWH